MRHSVKPARMDPARLLMLRRPCQVVRVEGRFVPLDVELDAVDAAWERVRARVPRSFDGPLLHVAGASRNGHGGVVIHCLETSYRFHAVAAEGIETGVRPLGVKGVSRCADGRVLMARRGTQTLNYAGEWEFSPGGSLEPGVEPVDALLRELREETGWTASSTPVARALMYDPTIRTWEIVFTLDVVPGSIPVEGWECSELAQVTPGEWPAPLSAIAARMVPLVGRLLSAT